MRPGFGSFRAQGADAGNAMMPWESSASAPPKPAPASQPGGFGSFRARGSDAPTRCAPDAASRASAPTRRALDAAPRVAATTRCAPDAELDGAIPRHHTQGVFATGHTVFAGSTEVLAYTQHLDHQFIEEYKQAHGMAKAPIAPLAPALDPSTQPSHPFNHQVWGPGRQEPRGFEAKRKPARDVPISNTKIWAREGMRGDVRSTLAARSSNVVGGWWDDPVFRALQEQAEAGQAGGTRGGGGGEGVSRLRDTPWALSHVPADETASSMAASIAAGVKTKAWAAPPSGVGLTSSSELGRFYHDSAVFAEAGGGSGSIPAATRKFNRRRVIDAAESSSFALADLPTSDRML